MKWKSNDPERPGAVRGRVAVTKMKDGKDIIIAGNENKFLRAYDLNTGDKVWTSAISADEQVLSDLIVLGDEVIFSTLSQGQVVAAFNIETGQKSWSVNLQTEITRVQTATNVPVVYQTVEPSPVATGNATAEPNATAAATSQQ
jgi:outer membrane protein assembly factor BamB